MIQKFIEKLMGQAAQGQRKMAFGTLALILLWVFIMWAPKIKEETRRSGLTTLAGVVVVVITGNVMEHRAKAKESLAKFTRKPD